MRWVGTRVRVHIKSVLPCYVLLSELLVPYDLFLPMLPQALHLVPPLEVLQICFGVLNHGDGAWCCYCIVGYQCVIGVFTWSGYTDTSCLSWRRPLCLFIDCCFKAFGIMLNNPARLINTVLCVSFIVANGPFGVGFCNYSTKSCASSVVAPVDKILGILTLWGKNSTTSEILSDLVSVTNNL